MHPCAKPLAALSLTVTLALAGAAANATTFAMSFKNQNAASFSDSITPGSTGFNDLFTFTTSDGSDRSSTIARSSDGNYSDGFNTFGLPDLFHDNSDNEKDSIIKSGFDSDDHHIAWQNPDRDYGHDPFGIFHDPDGGYRNCGGIPVKAVPEPGEYALMLCGLGLIGIVAIRRKQPHGLTST